jgi:purine-binding chemotaxis protein CheW
MAQNENTKNTFLTFRLGTETFAAPIDKAVSIIEVPEIIKVPRSPSYMRGIINVRGTVMPVVDARMKFGMTPIEIKKRTVIVTFRVDIENEKVDVGALVDEPGAVVQITKDQIMNRPDIGSKYKSELITGAFSINGQFIMLVDIDKVFTMDELTEINQTTEPQEIK